MSQQSAKNIRPRPPTEHEATPPELEAAPPELVDDVTDDEDQGELDLLQMPDPVPNIPVITIDPAVIHLQGHNVLNPALSDEGGLP
ncbi:hypothetical protein BGZ93_002555 [Podila epicladia]|nr:hypothetical protein BGZ92_004109 [Podila epicladia]KAG0100317.1 hypothetical protein BGZ93_002555 [Podila epicladia]